MDQLVHQDPQDQLVLVARKDDKENLAALVQLVNQEIEVTQGLQAQAVQVDPLVHLVQLVYKEKLVDLEKLDLKEKLVHLDHQVISVIIHIMQFI